jgi:hypothetical protein
LLFPRAIAYITNSFGINVDRINRAACAHTPRRAHGEPSRSCANVGHTLSACDAKNVHHAINLKSILPPRGIENRQISGVRFASLALLARRRNRRPRRVLSRRGTDILEKE